MRHSQITDSHVSLAAFVPQASRSLNTKRSFPRNLSSRRPRTGLLAVRCVKANPNEMLTGDQLQEWGKVTTLLKSIDPTLQQAEADKLVGRAFGWGTQKFWRGDVKQEPPSLDSAQRSLQFLREQVALDEKGLATLVKSFPEVLRLTVARMQENISYIQRTYPNIKGQLLINTVKGTPAVLGYDYDCEESLVQLRELHLRKDAFVFVGELAHALLMQADISLNSDSRLFFDMFCASNPGPDRVRVISNMRATINCLNRDRIAIPETTDLYVWIFELGAS